MPPFGLYPVPRHHLYGGRTKSKIYNTNDFQDDQEAAATAAASSSNAPTTIDAAVASQSVAHDTKDKKKAAKQEKKRLSSLSVDKNAELERLLDRAEAVSKGEGRPEKKKNKRKQRRSEEGAHHGATQAGNITPALPSRSQKVDKKGAEQICRSKKKRKRVSEAHKGAANAQSANEEYLAGQKLDSFLRFGSSPTKTSSLDARAVERASKKIKRKRHSMQQKAAERAQSKHIISSDQPEVQKTKRKQQTTIPGSSKAATEHSPLPALVSVPRGWIDGSDEWKMKEHKKSQATIGLVKNPATPSPVSTQTPIPFPQLSQESTTKPTRTKPPRNDEEGPLFSNMLVPETPPSKAPQRTPVPLPPEVKTRSDTAATDHISKQNRQRVLVSSPTPIGDVSESLAAPAALESSQTVPALPSVPNALTDANLRSFKRPLMDGTKPQPRTKTGASTVTSVRTPSASMSILEAFARVGKPYVRSAAEKDSFVANSGKPKSSYEDSGEVALDVFADKYREVTKIVNFDEEDQYLEDHLDWDAKHNEGPAPCLHKMTGCSAKREELIRLSKESSMEILAQLDTPGDDITKLDEATTQAQRAEDLLMLATRARIPVPIGCIEGRWTLYCPKYAETHFDRYGYGQRSLVISSIAGFKHKNTFTARMQLPPRTMAFSILAFETPPHASFRTTTIQTASEGYTMDVLFLGNGFLHLRADLGRLLSGTIRKPHEDYHVMEFIGVHERATQWWVEKKEEAEEEGEGRELFAKYDSPAGGK